MRQKKNLLIKKKLGLTVSMKMNHKYAFSEYVKKCHETVKIKTIKKSWKNMENVFFFYKNLWAFL